FEAFVDNPLSSLALSSAESPFSQTIKSKNEKRIFVPSTDRIRNLIIRKYGILLVRRRGVVGRVPTFHSGDPGSNPGGIKKLNKGKTKRNSVNERNQQSVTVA
ncbi:hypothetical protein L9F63_017183, partial [Diploptera punctata]